MKIIDCVYLREENKLIIAFDTHPHTMWIPCDGMWEFEGCSPDDLEQIRFCPHEPSIHIEHKDIDINLRWLVIHYLDYLRMQLDPEGDYPLYLRKHP